MAFASNQDQNENYIFNDMLNQDDIKYFFCDDLGPEFRNKNGKLRTSMSIWSFKRKIFPDGQMMKHKARLCAYSVMQQWVVSYWKTYVPIVNWILVRTLLAISSIH